MIMWPILLPRSGVGAPKVTEVDGNYKHDSRHSVLEWSLPVIDASNKSGSMEFSIAGHPDDFFPVTLNFLSRKSYCDIQVSRTQLKLMYSASQKKGNP